MNVWSGLSAYFKQRLLALDPHLLSIYDVEQEAIIVWSKRPGRPQQHEFTSRRKFLQDHPTLLKPNGDPMQVMVETSIPELESFTIKKLREIDVWKNHGDGKSFDEWLHNEEETIRQNRQKAFREHRKEYWKEHRRELEAVLWNAQYGRFTEKEAQPYEWAGACKK